MTKLKTKFGRIYKKYTLRAGVKTESSTWTVRFKGKDYATGTSDPKEAKKFLDRLAGDIAHGNRPGAIDRSAPASQKVVMMAELFDDLAADAARRGNATARENNGRVDRNLRPFFGHITAAGLTTDSLNRYKDKRIEVDEAEPATVNKELALLKRALNLGLRHEPRKVTSFPYIEMLKVSNVRKGFVRPADYAALRDALPDYLKPVFVVAYHVGNRRGELLQLEMRDVDLDEAQFRLYPDATKSGEGRVVPVYGEMLPVLRAQIDETRSRYPQCPFVFHNEGREIQTFYKAWASATEAVGLHGLYFHDLRRTAVRNLTRSGTPERVAMAITGHKTRHIFQRYDITDEADLRLAATRMTAYLTEVGVAL